jgi:membrane-associated phospholipid phosphatase
MVLLTGWRSIRRKIQVERLPSTLLTDPDVLDLKVLAAAALLFATCLPAPSSAQLSSRSDPIRFVHYLRSDATALGPALMNASPLAVAGISSAILGTSGFDVTLQDRAEALRQREFIRVVNEFGDVNAVRPFTVIVFVGSLMQPNDRFQDAAFTSFEAVLMSNLAANALKAAFGRSRPRQNRGADDFEPFSGNTSFPSGHATTVFAFVTPWLAYYSGPATWAAAAVAGGTAVARLSLRYHWPSDVVAGGALGAMTGLWLSRRHQGRIGATRVRPIAGPGTLGLRVVW